MVYKDDVLCEGTGLYGASSLREVDLETGAATRSWVLPDDLFGEGIAAVDDRIVQPTWRSNLGLVYRRDSFELLGEFFYPTEGGGLTDDGGLLIVSDGTATSASSITTRSTRSVASKCATATSSSDTSTN